MSNIGKPKQKFGLVVKILKDFWVI